MCEHFPKSDWPKEEFWAHLEARGLCFLRDEAYRRVDPASLPKRVEIGEFRNDVFRSLGGYLRVHKVLKRGKDRFFFEFRWGYFFWLNRHDAYGLWPDARLHRGFNRMLQVVSDIDQCEYMREHLERSASVEELMFLSANIIEPSYRPLTFYAHHLAQAYADLGDPEARCIPGLTEIFGPECVELPGQVLPQQSLQGPPEDAG